MAILNRELWSSVRSKLNAMVSLTGTQTLSNKTLTLPKINDTSADHTYNFAVSELAANRTITLPLLTVNDTFVFAAFAQTLTNKTFDIGDNSVTGTISEFNSACSDADFCTLAGSETLTNKRLTSAILTSPSVFDTSADHKYNITVSELAADRDCRLPLLTGSDEFTFNDHAQTLTNKTFDFSDNSVTATAAEFDAACSDDDFAYQSDLTAYQQNNGNNLTKLRIASVTGNTTISASHGNAVMLVTNSGATAITFERPSVITSFEIGWYVYVFNESGSSNNVTLSTTGGSSITGMNSLGTTLTPGQGALLIATSTTGWHRII